MKRGLIVYTDYDAKCNRFFINKCLELLNDEDFSLKYINEDELLSYIENNKLDFVIYRGRDYRLLEKLQSRGIKIFNKVFHFGKDSLLTRSKIVKYISGYLKVAYGAVSYAELKAFCFISVAIKGMALLF